MDAGRLDQKILIETATETTNALKETASAWATHSEPFARVIETPGREFLKGQFLAEGKAVFQVRYRSLGSKARVTWRGRVYTVEDVTGTKREGYSWLHTRSVTGEN